MTVVRLCEAPEAEARLPELAALLVDAVTNGASVNFMAGFTTAAAEAFWRSQLPGLRAGERQLLVAEALGRIVGTAVGTVAPQPNGPHRAEIGKMLVQSSHRRQGLGRRLLHAAEDTARATERTLLLLDTEAGGAGASLYTACGWTPWGTVPGHSYTPDGRLADALNFYKVLGPHRTPPLDDEPGTAS